jgi:hypothetical protein
MCKGVGLAKHLNIIRDIFDYSKIEAVRNHGLSYKHKL